MSDESETTDSPMFEKLPAMRTPIETDPILFEHEFAWQKEWIEMPEFIQPKLRERVINVRFRNENDVKRFGELIKQKLTRQTRSIWFPELEQNNNKGNRYQYDASADLDQENSNDGANDVDGLQQDQREVSDLYHQQGEVGEQADESGAGGDSCPI